MRAVAGLGVHVMVLSSHIHPNGLTLQKLKKYFPLLRQISGCDLARVG
jgi:hypothetical protein